MTGAGFYTFIYDLTADSWLLVNPNPTTTQFFYGASVFQSSFQVVGAGNTLVHFDTVEYDNFSMFNSFQNSFTPLRAGYYLVTAFVLGSPLVTTGSAALNLFKNGIVYRTLDQSPFPGG
jgi:hypothetical protein